jgi:predicted fused transcriptional regulator/phosphomethylpyrimidine kinase
MDEKQDMKIRRNLSFLFSYNRQKIDVSGLYGRTNRFFMGETYGV